MSYMNKNAELKNGYNAYIDSSVDDMGTQMDVGLLLMEAGDTYVYEDAKTAGAAVSLICPNCGAPIQKLGLKKCEYCGSVLEVQNKKAWRLLEMREK